MIFIRSKMKPYNKLELTHILEIRGQEKNEDIQM